MDYSNDHTSITICTNLLLRQITVQFFAFHTKQAENYAHLMRKFLATKKDNDSMLEVLFAQRSNQR